MLLRRLSLVCALLIAASRAPRCRAGRARSCRCRRPARRLGARARARVAGRRAGLRAGPRGVGGDRPRPGGPVERRLRRRRRRERPQGGAGHDLQHLLDLEALHERRGDAAARRGQAAPRRRRALEAAVVHDEAGRDGRDGDHGRGPAHARGGAARARPTSRTGPAPRSRSRPTIRSSRDSASQTALYPAETYFQYSNLGLTLAGEIVSAASGMPYADYVAKNILAPAEAREHDARDAREGAGEASRDRVQRDDARRAAREPSRSSRARASRPRWGSPRRPRTSRDSRRGSSALLGGGEPGVLKASTLREMHRVHFVDPDFETMWGLGFGV